MNPDDSFHERDFLGDETGQIFTASDAVPDFLGSTERTVDTQSGFVVNVKNIDGRISLSVKRRVGTPPTSSVVFTPDESLKLSKILALSSGDELTGMANYYAAAGARNNARASRVGNLMRSLPATPKLGGILLLTLLLVAAALGYYTRPILNAWLKINFGHSLQNHIHF